METTFKNNLGQPYTIEILTRTEALTALREVSIPEIVKLAYADHSMMSGCKTIVSFDLSTGELTSATYLGNGFDLETAHLIELYSLEGNDFQWSYEDMLDDDEIEKYLQANDGSTDEIYNYIENLADFDERFTNWIEYCADSEYDSNEKEAAIEAVYNFALNEEISEEHDGELIIDHTSEDVYGTWRYSIKPYYFEDGFSSRPPRLLAASHNITNTLPEKIIDWSSIDNLDEATEAFAEWLNDQQAEKQERVSAALA